MTNGAGKRAQWLRGLAALLEDPVQFPALTWQLTTICVSSAKEQDAIFWPPWYIHGEQAFIQTKHIYA